MPDPEAGAGFEDRLLVETPEDVRPQRQSFFRPVQQALLVLAISLAAFAVLAALYSVRMIVLATLIGVGFGTLVSPTIVMLREKLRIPKVISVLLFLALILGLFAGVTYLTLSLLTTQIIPLVEKLPELFNSAQDRAASLLKRIPVLQNQVRAFNAQGIAQKLAETVMTGLTVGAAAIGGFFFVIAVGLYLAADSSSYLNGLLSAFPSHIRPRTREVLGAAASTMRRWFGAQMIAMLAVGMATGLGLLALGIESWLVLGVITGLLDFIPYLGPFVSAGLALITTLATQPEKAVWVAGLFLAIQQLEGDFLIPMVMKGSIKLPPIHLMALMLAMGKWFGVLGVFVAPPLLAVLRTIYLMTYKRKMDQMTRPPLTPDSKLVVTPEKRAG